MDRFLKKDAQLHKDQFMELVELVQNSIRTLKNLTGYIQSRSCYILGSFTLYLSALACNGKNASNISPIYPDNPVSPAYTLVFPQGGETFEVGSRYMVRWTSKDVPEDLLTDVRLVNPDGVRIKLATSTNDGEELITVPNVSQDMHKVEVGTTLDTKVKSSQSGSVVIVQAQNPEPIPQTIEILAGAGDVARLDRLEGAVATGKILQTIPGKKFGTGDMQYDDGTLEEFLSGFDKTPWGLFRNDIITVLGNHEWQRQRGIGYYAYFGSRVLGPDGLGYYSTNIGAWHLIALNSNIDAGPNSPQVRWLFQDLSSNNRPCTLALWHHPVISSGENGDQPQMAYIWGILYDFGVELVINGHDHLYERFAKMGKRLELDNRFGIREFIVGTGGHSLYRFLRIKSTSEVRYNSTFGILKLTLMPRGYTAEFIPVEGPYRDFVQDSCHESLSNLNLETSFSILPTPQEIVHGSYKRSMMGKEHTGKRILPF